METAALSLSNKEHTEIPDRTFPINIFHLRGPHFIPLFQGNLPGAGLRFRLLLHGPEDAVDAVQGTGRDKLDSCHPVLRNPISRNLIDLFDKPALP
jgi:hypothetical protein